MDVNPGFATISEIPESVKVKPSFIYLIPFLYDDSKDSLEFVLTRSIFGAPEIAILLGGSIISRLFSISSGVNLSTSTFLSTSYFK